MNRTYFDTYAFYVPYRLLWSDFPEFISSKANASDATVPLITDQPWSFVFEGNIFGVTPPEDGGGCNAFNRRAYNLIWQDYFRQDKDETQEPDLDASLPKTVSFRPSTFHESGLTTISREDTSIEDATTVDDLRSAFATDRFNRLREHYGSRYTDYLAALGVDSGWSITDEPESIGKSHKDLSYRNVNATVTTANALGPDSQDDYLADSAGYFMGKFPTKIKPTFCPEHGLIMVVGALKMDIVNKAGNNLPHLAKFFKDQFYSPEFETKTVQTWPASIWGEDSNVSGYTPTFEDYRKMSNFGGRTNVDPATLYYQAKTDASSNPVEAKTCNPDDYDDIFTGTMGGAANVHYTVSTQCRMVRNSAVRPQERVRGVS